MRSVIWLAQNGIPWDVANNLEEHERLAYAVIVGEHDGGEFDWDRMRWNDRK